jgi:hypothetical protein
MLENIGRVTEQKIGGLDAPSLISCPFPFSKKKDICGGEVCEPLKVVNCWIRNGFGAHWAIRSLVVEFPGPTWRPWSGLAIAMLKREEIKRNRHGRYMIAMVQRS